MTDFSVVVPIHNEVKLIPRSLPSYYNVEPSEMVLCFDNPPHIQAYEWAQKIAGHYSHVPTRFVFVERSDEWGFHQAHVRREGFHGASYPRILTGDIDLVINRNVLKAVSMVGHDDVGLVSLVKFRYPRCLTHYWRSGILLFLTQVLHGFTDPLMMTTTFSGLYALYRPYWRDSEPTEEIQKMVNPKQLLRGEDVLDWSHFRMGEDTVLRDCMVRKHRVVYLRSIGAIDLGVPTEYRPFIQYMIGRCFAKRGRSLAVSMGRAIIRCEPDYLRGYLAEKNKT